MPAQIFERLGAWLLTAIAVLASAMDAPAQGSYQVRPGDSLTIEVLEDPDLNRNVLVLPDGTISFPLVGTLSAQGRTVTEIRSILATRLASNFAVPPNVFVSVNTLAERVPPRRTEGVVPRPPQTIDTYIVGEVAKPGRVEVKPGTTILQLLSEAGGITKFAAHRRIELRRTDRKTGRIVTYLYSYSGRANGPRISGGTVLAPGDVVVVPQRRLFE